MEKPAAIALPGHEAWVLDGRYAAADSDVGAVVAPPHPLYGGSMDSPVVSELVHALGQADIASLRFDWRGIGGSGGQASGDFAAALDDYAAALDFVRDSVSGPLIAGGYSFGAATALRAARAEPRVDRLLLVAPPPAMIEPRALEDFAGRTFIAVGDRDEFAPVADLEARVAGLDDTQLVVLPETDHFFLSGVEELGRLASRWLAVR